MIMLLEVLDTLYGARDILAFLIKGRSCDGNSISYLVSYFGVSSSIMLPKLVQAGPKLEERWFQKVLLFFVIPWILG